ncbi:hypothetical protein Tco_1460161 [Tanacetum coccineum]
MPAALSPTADSPGYIADSDPEEDPKEDPIDYPADGGDDDDDDDDEMSVRAQTPILLSLDILVARLLAIPTIPPSLLSSWSSPLPQIPSPPLPLILSPLPASPPLPVSSPPPLVSPTYPLGYRAAMIWLRAEAPSTSHPPPSSTPPSGTPPLLHISLPTPSPPLMLPSTDHRTDSSSAPAARPTRGFMVDYGFISTLDREIRRDLERDVGYGITDTWDEMLVDMPGVPATDDTELGQRMTDLVTTVKQDTDKIYGRLDDAKSKQHLMTGQLNILRRDRTAHARITLLMEREDRLSREAWRWSMDASDFARYEIQVTALQGQQGPARGPTQPEISEEAGSSS